jgi:hypothetical protein
MFLDVSSRIMVTVLHGKAAGKATVEAIKSAVTCYAAKLHLNRGASIIKPERTPKKGYAPTFEQLTKFEGRMATAAGWSDLLGTPRPGSPWKDDLPRMIFISDMVSMWLREFCGQTDSERVTFLRDSAHALTESIQIQLQLTRNSSKSSRLGLCAVRT